MVYTDTKSDGKITERTHIWGYDICKHLSPKPIIDGVKKCVLGKYCYMPTLSHLSTGNGHGL